METSILFPSDPEYAKERDSSSIRPFSIYNSSTGRNRPLAVIVALGRDREIGRHGDLPWHIPADLRHFKALTLGHPVIMGRATWLSLPKKPLPGRRNIVISRNPSFTAEGAEVFNSIEAAIAACAPAPIPFVIGGGSVYAQALPLATELHLTRVDANCPDADTFFQEINPEEWTLSERGEDQQTPDGVPFRFETYTRSL